MEVKDDHFYEIFLSSTSAILNTTKICGAVGELSKWFWSPSFWLPVNFTWDEIQPRPDFQYPNNNDILKYPIYVAIFLLLLRNFVINPYVFHPIARYYKLNLKKPPPPKENKKLEKLYLKYNTKVPLALIDRASKELKWKVSDVQMWLRQRRLCTRLTMGDKFSDSGFMLLAHAFFCFLGVYALYDKVWVWNITHCWYKYPHHEVDNDVWFYYMFGIGLYLSITVHQLMQPTRKDRLSIYLHHFFTILLMSFSWIMNFVRVGTVVLFVHQCVDWLLLVAKLFHYLKFQEGTNVVFGLTILVWFTTRMIIFPFYILRSAFFEGPTYMFMPSAYLFFALLLGLLLLNGMWLKMMLTIVVKKLQSGKLEDVRSSDELSETEEIEEKKRL